MIKAFGTVWQNHWRDNLWLYLLVLLCLISGVVLGTISVKLLTVEETTELGEYLAVFIGGLEEVNLDQLIIIRQSLYNNLKTMGLIWFLGLTVLGTPLILIILLVKGFTLGFTTGFLVQEQGLQGILLALMALTPPNVILMPVLVTSAVVGITFSVWLVKGRHEIRRTGISQHFLAYSLSMGVLSILAIVAGVFEGYCSPALMKLVISFLNH